MDYVCPKCRSRVKLSTNDKGILTENTIKYCPNCGEIINYINPIMQETKDSNNLVDNAPTATNNKPLSSNAKRGNGSKKWIGCAIIGIIVLLVSLVVLPALVMVFGGNLRNMLEHTNNTLEATKPTENYVP